MDLKRRGTLRGSKNTGPLSLPDDVLTDLKLVIDSLRKPDNPDINRSDVRSIVHNFGNYGIKKSEFDKLLKKLGINESKSYFNDSEIIEIVTSVWFTNGKNEEANDCFKAFDKT